MMRRQSHQRVINYAGVNLLEDLVGGVRARVLEVRLVGREVREYLVALLALVAAGVLVPLDVVLDLDGADHLVAYRALLPGEWAFV